MIKEIVNKYENFSDALILEIVYRAFDNSKNVEVVLNCMNVSNDYRYERIKLFFNDILSIRFHENENQSGTVINSALITNDNGIIVFDFFPLVYGEAKLKENENSDFKIKCKEVRYISVE